MFLRKSLIISAILAVLFPMFFWSIYLLNEPKEAGTYAKNEVELYARPVLNWKLMLVDHTYTCLPAKDECYAQGGISGGHLILEEDIEEKHIKSFICITGCNFHYGRNGTCHQYSNRTLFWTGETIPAFRVRGYNQSKFLFGIYGDTGPEDGRFSSCLKRCIQEKDYETFIRKMPAIKTDDNKLRGIINNDNYEFRKEYYAKLEYNVAVQQITGLSSVSIKNFLRESTESILDQFEPSVEFALGNDSPHKKEIREVQKEIIRRFQEGDEHLSGHIAKLFDFLTDEEFRALFMFSKAESKSMFEAVLKPQP